MSRPVVLQRGERAESEHGAPQRAAPAEHRRAAEDDGGDRVELESGTRVRLGLPEVRDVDDRGDAGRETRQHIDEADPLRHRQSGVSRSGRRESDRIQRPPHHGSMQQHPVRREHEQEYGKLRRHNTADVSLPEKQERRGKAAVAGGSARAPLGDPAKHRERSERHDERRQPEPGHRHRVERAACEPDKQRGRRRDRDRQMPVDRGDAEDDRGEPHHRADGQIDAARDENRRQRHRQESELYAQARDLEQVARREKVRRDHREDRDLDGEREREQPHAGSACRPRSPSTGLPRAVSTGNRLRARSASAATAATMIAP